MCHCLCSAYNFTFLPLVSSLLPPRTFQSYAFITSCSSTARPMMDLTIENITQNVHEINSQCPDRRFRYILERVVVHLHDLVRETRLSTGEWMKALEFLTDVGQTCTDVRQVSKFSLLHEYALILRAIM